jgi:hypothetical protein
VVYYITICLECQKVKVEHTHLDRLLQPFPIHEWKREVVIVDFITKLSIKMKQRDSIMGVVVKLTKATHFILVKTTHKETNIDKIYMKKIARLHGVPKVIIFHRDPKFRSNFWKGLFKGFGTNLNFSTTYHPDSDGKTKRTNMIIEYVLRMYAMDQT